MIARLRKTYTGKVVLLTGHTGFKGSWLSLWLKQLGARVIGYSLDPPTHPSFFETAGVASELTDVRGDIRDLEHLRRIFSVHQPQLVFHLAAQPLVRLSYAEPRLTYETNVMGTVNVLEAVRLTPSVRAVINVTSDKCYENRDGVWGYRECDSLGGCDPYSSSKACCELVTAAYRQSYFPVEQHGKTHAVALASARAGNVIGGGDWGTDRLVPDCVRALHRNDEIVLRYPKAIRPWQHVLEPLNGYLLLAAKLWQEGPIFAGPWNFGPAEDDVWSVEEVVQEIIQLWGQGHYRAENTGQPHEAHWLKLDCSKARLLLNWRPRYTVRKALALSIDWYRRFYTGDSEDGLRCQSRDQIAAYMAAPGEP
jgi:CDP-glucose 4,6-dehydratase